MIIIKLNIKVALKLKNTQIYFAFEEIDEEMLSEKDRLINILDVSHPSHSLKSANGYTVTANGSTKKMYILMNYYLHLHLKKKLFYIHPILILMLLTHTRLS